MDNNQNKSNLILYLMMTLVVLLVVSNAVTMIFLFSRLDKAEDKESTEKSITEEQAELELDADNDGLSDAREKALGTNPAKSDTDGDGFSDKEEVDNGFDPLVARDENNEDNVSDTKEAMTGNETGDLVITWNTIPKKVEYTTAFRGDVDAMEREVKKFCDGSQDMMGSGCMTTAKETLENLDIYEVGKVKSGAFAGRDLYDIQISFFGGKIFRFVNGDKMPVLITENSSETYDIFKVMFAKYDDGSIDNLDVVSEIKIPNSSIKLVLSEEDPGLMYLNMSNTEKKATIGDVVVYKDYSRGCFFTKAPDGSIRDYYMDISFLKSKGDASQGGLTPYLPSITWDDGTKNDDDYLIATHVGCGSTGCYSYADYVSQVSQLMPIGNTSSGDKVYELRDKNTARGEEKKTIYQTVYDYFYVAGDKISYEDFLKDRPLVYWQDPFGDFLVMQKAEYQPAVECGKPVIYLYPEEETDVKVYVAPNGGFSVTEPLYNNGWSVRAKSDGELYNYADEKTYPYLFWEGTGVYYERPEEGFVVAREDVYGFLVEKLSLLGLVEHEYDEFIEFWYPKMQEKPYYFVTFVPKADFDKIAPLSVFPKPDNIIRVFMDFQGLNNPISVIEQEIVTPVRSGFTVVEWGGALR